MVVSSEVRIVPPTTQRRIQPQTGCAFELARGQTLRVIDPEGEQVADLTAFAAVDPVEGLSSGRSLDYNGTVYLSTGQSLYSNRSRPMLTITYDTVGRHDFLLAPCSQEMFELLHGQNGFHPSCFQNLAITLDGYGISPDAISTTFNIFMNVAIAPDGRLEVQPPRSRSGDYIELLAEMDLYVGLTACSAEQTNNGSLKPIDFEVC
jgi:uncharacterized protein YcgI (DUF1989 family)